MLADALEGAGIPYAIGGAIAYGFWGPPRGTNDIDINVFLEAPAAGPALDALNRAGMVFDRLEAERRVADGAHVRGFVDRTPIDVYFNSIPFHLAAAEGVQTRPILGRPARVLSAEATAVLKMLFHRGKDRVDLERMVGLMGKTLDAAYVRRWLVECVGDDDHRIAEWDELVRDLA
jgi:hypothetical protein